MKTGTDILENVDARKAVELLARMEIRPGVSPTQ